MSIAAHIKEVSDDLSSRGWRRNQIDNAILEHLKAGKDLDHLKGFSPAVPTLIGELKICLVDLRTHYNISPSKFDEAVEDLNDILGDFGHEITVVPSTVPHEIPHIVTLELHRHE